MIGLESKFWFGKYKGFKIKDVWTGPTEPSSVIKNYFLAFSEFRQSEYVQKVRFLVPNIDHLRLGTSLSIPSGVNLVVSDRYLIIEGGDTSVVDEGRAGFLNLFSGRFDFVRTNWLVKGTHGHEITLTSCLQITADPNYILWCIKKVNGFSFDESELEAMRELESRVLEKIMISEIKSDLLEYKACYKTSRVRISETIEKTNSRKNELINETQTGSPEEGTDRQSRSFGEYSGSYAQDVMGYSDQEINDAFDGDPDAYWNID